MILYFALVTSTLFGSTLLIGGAQNSVQQGVAKLGADIMVVPSDAKPLIEAHLLTGSVVAFYFSSNIVSQVSASPGVELVCSQLYIATLSDAPCCSLPVTLIGIDPTSDFTIRPWLTTNLKRDLGQDEAIIGTRIIGTVGGELEFYGHDFTVAGILEPTGTGLDTSVFVPIETAYIMAEESATKAVEVLEIPENAISAVLVKVYSTSNVEGVANQIKASISGVETITTDLMLGKVGEQLSSVVQGLYTTSISVTLVMLPMIGVIISMVVNERRREIGLLRALGSTKSFIFELVTLETVLIAVIGGALGAITVTALVYGFTEAIMFTFGIPYLWMSFLDTIILAATYVAVAVAVGAVAVLYPAVNASRIEPYQAMRREP